MSIPAPPPRRLTLSPALVGAALPALAACAGPQSWIDPAGTQAAAAATLFWAMAAGAALVWLSVIGVMIYGARAAPVRPVLAHRLVIWGGMAAPTAVVLTLLVAGLFLLRALTAATPELTVEAKGEQWWWRIDYEGRSGAPVAVANELRLPVGQTVQMVLRADDVIHSFWVPSLGGKMDMIPGRTTRLLLTPTKTGRFRGACAEFCGGAHAQMNLPVVVMEPAAYRDWLAGQARPAVEPTDERARRGRDLFLATGCGACHAIRGTPADGRLAPDLTHVGSRLTIGAGVLPMNAENMARWITGPGIVKPGVRMPAFGMLPAEEIALIATYLMSLK